MAKKKSEKKQKKTSMRKADRLVKNLFSMFRAAKKAAARQDKDRAIDSQIDGKLAQRLDSAGHSDFAREIAETTEDKPSFLQRFFAGFAARPLSYRISVIGGGMMSVFVFFGLLAFALIWYRGGDLPILRDIQKRPPVLVMDKQVETEYGVGIEDNEFLISTRDDVAFRSLGINNKVSVTPRFNYDVELEENNTQLRIVPSGDLAEGTEYQVTLRKGTMFSDGSSLAKDMTWVFQTEPRFDVVGITPRDGSTTAPVDTTIEVQFNYRDLDVDQFESYFEINPSVSGKFELHGKKIVFRPAKRLVPGTIYEVVIKKGFKNSRGDELTEDHVSKFKISSVDSSGKYIDYPMISWSEHKPIISVSKDLRITVLYDDVTTNTKFNVYRTTKSALINMVKDYQWDISEKPSDSELTLVSTFYRSPSQLNQVTVDFDDYGIYFIEAYNSQYGRSIYKYAVYTPVAAVVSDSLNNQRTWVFDVNDKEPVSGAEVEFYDLDKSISPIAADQTDGNGYGDYEGSGIDLVIVDYLGNLAVGPNDIHDWWMAISPWGVANESFRSYVYTDKPIYRPGDEVKFKAIVRREDDMSYSLPGDKEVTVRVGTSYYYWNDLQKSPIYEESYNISRDFGTISGSFVLPANTPTDYQTIELLIDGEKIGYHGFRVAEYVKPRYQIELSFDKTRALSGELVNIDIWGKDYSGDPAQGLKVKLSVDRRALDDVNWFDSASDYDQNISNYWGSGNEAIVDTTMTLDSNGHARYPLRVYFDSGVANFGRYSAYISLLGDFSSYDSERIEVAGPDSALFAKAESLSVREGEDNTINLRTVNLWDFSSKGGVKVEVVKVKRTWSELTQVGTYYNPDTMSEDPMYEIVKREETVMEDHELTTDSSGNASFALTDLGYGSYDMMLKYYDENGYTRVFSGVFYVFEESDDGKFYDWDSEYQKIRLYFDKDEYNVGDKAEINIQSTLEGKGIFMISRGDVYDWKIVDFSTGLVSIQEEITDSMAPTMNVCVWGVDEYIQNNGSGSQLLTNILTEDCEVVTVNKDYKKLEIKITPDQSVYEPGDEVVLDLEVTDGRGKGVEAELSVDVIDKALLDLVESTNNYGNPYDIHGSFYEAVNQWAGLYSSMYYYSYTGGGFGAGGSGGDDTRVDFEDIAHWDGKVKTDSSGKAEVKLHLPDNLTTWVACVVGVTTDTLVGSAETEFIARKDVTLDAKVPEFLRSSDVWNMNLEMKNFSSSSIDAKLIVDCDGCEDEKVEKNVSLSAGRRVEQVVKIDPSEGEDEVRIKAALTSSSKTYDIVEWKIPVIGEGLMRGETISDYMTGDENESQLEFELPEGTNEEDALLTISFARSFVNEYALLPVDSSISSSAELASSMIHNSVLYKYYDEIDPSEERGDYQRRIEAAVDLLRSNQDDNGGFGWFDYDAVSYETSAYVGVALGNAIDSGALDPGPMTENLAVYLKSGLEGDEKSVDEKAFAIYALSCMGEEDIIPFAVWFKNNAEGLEDSSLSVAHLMLAFQNFGGVGDAGELIPLLIDSANESDRAATWEDEESDFRVVKSVEYTTAVVYLALHEYNQTELGEKARNWLIDNPVYLSGNSVDSVGIFYSLTIANIDNLSGRKGVNKVSLKVNGKDVKTFDVGGDENSIGKYDVSVDSRFLKEGKNRIEIERSGNGDLYSVATVRYYTTDIDEDNEFEVKRYIRDFYTGASVSKISKGQVVMIRTEVKVDRDGYNLVVHDFIPAGFEPVQYEFGRFDYDFLQKWWRWGSDDYTNRYGDVAQDHVTFEEYKVSDGKIYSFEFPAVATFSGSFSGAGSQGYLLGFEDIGGMTWSGAIEVTD
ncbi:Ig-like domain-containing protein [Candidatus Dojkabacteria bacterium]|nr:Ig-like domain-containing protein [Candidatus Dojkabacteria bacterium]